MHTHITRFENVEQVGIKIIPDVKGSKDVFYLIDWDPAWTDLWSGQEEDKALVCTWIGGLLGWDLRLFRMGPGLMEFLEDGPMIPYDLSRTATLVPNIVKEIGDTWK